MWLTALANILGHDNRWDRPTEVLLMAAYGQQGVVDRPNMRVMRWRNGELSGSDFANEPGLGSSRSYQPGEIPLLNKPSSGLWRMHQEMNSEFASFCSHLRAAVPHKRVRVKEEVQTKETIETISEKRDQLKRIKEELAWMQQNRELWIKRFKDANRRQKREIARPRRNQHVELLIPR